MHPSLALPDPRRQPVIAYRSGNARLGASQCLFGDPEEIRRLIAHKVSQVTLYLSGASQCLFGDPEEIRRLNAHKVSQ